MSDSPIDPAALLPHASDASDPYARTAETFPRLTPEQVARVTALGSVEQLQRGTVLFERDDRSVDFFLVLEGHIEIYEPGPTGEPVVMTIHAEHQFTGELDLFNDRTILVGGRMGVDGRVVRLGRSRFRRMLAAEPDIAEILMRAFVLRRTGFVEHGQAGVTIVAPRRSGEALRIQRFLGRNGHPFTALDAAEDRAAAQLLREHGLQDRDQPVVLCGPNRTLVRPSNLTLGQCLGITEPLDPSSVADVAIVGAGPSGLAAAVYAASEGLDTIVLEREAPGGQAGTSSRIENYLGFPTGISGPTLAARAQVQAQKFGARIAVPRCVERLRTETEPYVLELADGGRIRSRSVIVASGARYRTLDHLSDLERFEGNGIHYAATAIEAALCGAEEVVVVGGGNSAGQAAMFLTRHAKHVHMLIRGESLSSSMSDYLVSRIEAVPERITLHRRTEITSLAGKRHLEQITWRCRDAERDETRPTANLFLMLGAVPNTEWLTGALDLDANGFVVTSDGLATSRPGVFAVGDVRAQSSKRVASAVGEGSVVIAAVHQSLADL